VSPAWRSSQPKSKSPSFLRSFAVIGVRCVSPADTALGFPFLGMRVFRHCALAWLTFLPPMTCVRQHGISTSRQRYGRAPSSTLRYTGPEALPRRVQKRSARTLSMVRPLLVVATLCFATPLLAQSPPASSPTSAPPPSKQSDATPSAAKK
jgi:hypothetical protein